MITEETSIDYDVHGEGPPLILIGGLGFGRWGFFKQVPAFSRHFRTITFDVRGEQDLDSGVADLTANVVALLEHLGVRRAHVLGTSLDRKSTRLNSSHANISYAVFCLKKNNKKHVHLPSAPLLAARSLLIS